MDFNIIRCMNSQGGRRTSSGVCVSQQGRARVAELLSLPLCPISPDFSPPSIHTQPNTEACPVTADLIMRVNLKTDNNKNYNTCTWSVRATYVVRAMYQVWLSIGSCCVRKGCCKDCSEGIRNMKEHESASFYGCYMTLCPWLRFGRKLEG